MPKPRQVVALGHYKNTYMDNLVYDAEDRWIKLSAPVPAINGWPSIEDYNMVWEDLRFDSYLWRKHVPSIYDVSYWVNNIVQTVWFRNRFKLRYDSVSCRYLRYKSETTAWADCRNDTLYFSTVLSARRQMTVLHELAHLCDTQDTCHGKNFRSIYLALVRKFHYKGEAFYRGLREEFRYCDLPYTLNYL